MTRRAGALAAAAAVVTAAAAYGSAHSGVTVSARGHSWTVQSTSARVVVRAAPGELAVARGAVRAAGGTVTASLPIVDGFAARLPATAVGALGHAPGVLAVTPDSRVEVSASSYPTAPNGSIAGASYAKSSRASQAWAEGDYGSGVTVAVVDTGVAAVTDLRGRVVAGPDFSGEHNSTLDSYGHGTVMAGIVAGNGSASGGVYTGIAPQARVVSVKVAGRSGATDVSTMLAALQWTGSYASQYGIRVVELAWGTRSTQSPAVDPLDFAVERLWRMGIVVVVSAGNAGPGAGTITKPGDDPAVVTASAYDDAASPGWSDDATVDWSSRGPTAAGAAKPDLVAPGRTLGATRAPGSVIEQGNPQSLVGNDYILGSGTSQATAVTAGAAALILAAHPGETPDQVKYALTASTQSMSGVARSVQGTGRVSIARALDVDVTAAPTQQLLATGSGSIEASRGGRHVVTTCAGQSQPTTISGEMDALCRPWSADQWTADQWTADQWTADQWTADQWTADQWTADQWTADQWTADQWTADSWTADQWTTQRWDARAAPYRGAATALHAAVVE